MLQCQQLLGPALTCTKTVKNITTNVVVRKCPFGRLFLSSRSTRENATAPLSPPYAMINCSSRSIRRILLDLLMIIVRPNTTAKITFENNKNSAEVDIAPALGEITTVCNVGQAKPGHGACMKSTSRTYTMQGFILTTTEKCTLVVDLT